jgi:anti-sigma regulatory factor (Ser/Thr protein kinase)
MVRAMSKSGQSKRNVANAASFELNFNPSTELITVVRQFLENFYLRVLGDADVSNRVALTTHELLENAAKYSVAGNVRLYVQVDGQKGTAIVRTTNRAGPAQIERLRTCFEEIEKAADVGLYYAEMVRRSAHKTSGWGGLGLARIWAESDMTIRLVVTGDEIEIHADGPINSKR